MGAGCLDRHGAEDQPDGPAGDLDGPHLVAGYVRDCPPLVTQPTGHCPRPSDRQPDSYLRPFSPSIRYEVALLRPTHEAPSQLVLEFIETLRANLTPAQEE